MEVSVVFPACGEASQMLQPGECPLDFPSVSVEGTVSLREMSQRLVFSFDERTDQTNSQSFESPPQRVAVCRFVVDQARSSRQV
jgi:hypothetical protein